ncbi:LysR family transcriptional regulator [Paraburkholderia caballeronis]|uniref:DNA-binding transcriptional regulator, LysR family n=1 Tax=Paraburkholderia caballeronis TaxID=416943 RepID=A0A1H7R200_9BURK|nr:LysR family transcriptional regulator [Paraburkholderia caballeronis]PXW23712.1 LysR family transcriptional regulator [Paraburkholderia caballeronis]PXW99053.1 LysR family transcriptional regulator [Paraburkholderia caballeronis]RAJ96259.1 LysR family transcriptional regulator [Paraburkholderia caballeronis]TDV14380.1 LysR family transcriptional regulator [Paraburkholderia caballeronis]TDV15906.1 LysR family transcriptional regulator [Paraburkholderia caballeronis]
MDDHAASLDIWLVRVLRTLLVERSVTQTALRLNQTQPAISTALRRLREILGDPILVRGKSGMVPTEYGESLLQHAQRVLRDVDFVATPHGDFDPARSRRTFRVAAPDYLNDFFMPTLIASFRDAAPAARLEILSLSPTLDHHAALDAGELDLVIGNWPKPEPRFAKSDLFADTVVCMMRADHPLAREPLTRDAYLNAPHLAPTRYSGAKASAIDVGFAKAGAQRRVVATLPYFGLVPQVLLQSDLIFTTTRRFATHYANLLPLAVVEPPFAFPRIRCYQLWHPQPDRPGDVAWLRGLFADASRALTAGGGRRGAGRHGAAWNR